MPHSIGPGNREDGDVALMVSEQEDVTYPARPDGCSKVKLNGTFDNYKRMKAGGMGCDDPERGARGKRVSHSTTPESLEEESGDDTLDEEELEDSTDEESMATESEEEDEGLQAEEGFDDKARERRSTRARINPVSYMEILESEEEDIDAMVPAKPEPRAWKRLTKKGHGSAANGQHVEIMDQEDKENAGTKTNKAGRPIRQAARKLQSYTFDSESEEEDIVMMSEDESETEDKADIVEVSEHPHLGTFEVESILARRKGATGNREMHVKLVGKSYRETTWMDRDQIIYMGRQSLIQGFEKRLHEGKINPYGDLIDGIHPEWTNVDRIVTDEELDGTQYFLVKWSGCPYSECTWESRDKLASDNDKTRLEIYEIRKMAEIAKMDRRRKKESPRINPSDVPAFHNGRELRSYQLESLKWMVKNWYSSKNCILGDEMGLGKTAQSIAVMAFQRQFGYVSGPFLVIAPLTTLGHWQREIETWTDMNCILYCGNANDKQIIHNHEIWCKRDGRKVQIVKPDVVLSSYEHVMRDASFFKKIEWETMIIDEAHRMKGTKGATRTAIAEIPCQWILLLTGTPIQNNIQELYGILNLLDPAEYASEEDFLDRFGRSASSMTPDQVSDLQQALQPLLLRRMKEDVEDLPEKEECIIWIQLTPEQKLYYRAIFENQIGALLGGASYKNMKALKNVAMELRKVCCHPFLCDGVEDDMTERYKKRNSGEADELELLVSACGKMQLLHKLLPKLRKEKRKVLIFSQFKIMLNVLEDYASLMEYPTERIDGTTCSRDRQAAIDRFSTSSDGFIFLLSTKAGGQGITLTAADTCIIYDSDWNPQNDLQAMARCHRIGQDKDVTIYRLVSKDTYEENIFHTSSRKYGLDEAVLGGLGAKAPCSDKNPENDKRISELLKHGAHCLKTDETAEKETEAFMSENIDEILSNRTEKRQIGGRAGNTFSVATFGAEKDATANDKEFWQTLLPDAAKQYEENKKKQLMPEILPPRKKKLISYKEGKKRKGEDGFDSEGEDATDEDFKIPEANQPLKKLKSKRWTLIDIHTLFDSLMRYGMAETSFDLAIQWAGLEAKSYPKEEIPIIINSILRIYKEVIRNQVVKPKKENHHAWKGDAIVIEAIKKHNSRLQESYEKSLDTKVEKILEILGNDLSFEIPETADQALRDARLINRMLRHAEKYEQHKESLSAIKEFFIDGDKIPPFIKSDKLPSWSRIKDRQLLVAMFNHGWEPPVRPVKLMQKDMDHILRSHKHFTDVVRCADHEGLEHSFSAQVYSTEEWEKLLDCLVKRAKLLLACLINPSKLPLMDSHLPSPLTTLPKQAVQVFEARKEKKPSDNVERQKATDAPSTSLERLKSINDKMKERLATMCKQSLPTKGTLQHKDNSAEQIPVKLLAELPSPLYENPKTPATDIQMDMATGVPSSLDKTTPEEVNKSDPSHHPHFTGPAKARDSDEYEAQKPRQRQMSLFELGKVTVTSREKVPASTTPDDDAIDLTLLDQ